MYRGGFDVFSRVWRFILTERNLFPSILNNDINWTAKACFCSFQRWIQWLLARVRPVIITKIGAMAAYLCCLAISLLLLVTSRWVAQFCQFFLVFSWPFDGSIKREAQNQNQNQNRYNNNNNNKKKKNNNTLETWNNNFCSKLGQDLIRPFFRSGRPCLNFTGTGTVGQPLRPMKMSQISVTWSVLWGERCDPSLCDQYPHNLTVTWVTLWYFMNDFLFLFFLGEYKRLIWGGLEDSIWNLSESSG